MKRILALLAGLAVVLLAIAAAVYAVHVRSRTSAPSAAASPSASAGQTPSAAAEVPVATPRGEVTIDPRRQQLIGVRTVAVARQPVGQAIRAAGVVRYDETRQADINLKVEGWIRDLYVDYTGQPIQRGQRLFTIYSPDLLNTQNEYLLALKTRDQVRQSIIPDARERADQLVAAARQRLALWDFSPEALRTLDETRHAQEAVEFRSPVSGYVIEKAAVRGLHVMPGQSLYKVADLSTVWVEADVYESELPEVRVGEPAAITVDAYPGERFSGRAIYIYPYLDEKTRTNRVRFTFGNRAGRLKPGMYANVELQSRGGVGLVVPTNAVLDSGPEQVVFVAQGDGVFEPRKVKIGRRMGDATQILEGVKEGEQVATGATFFLDSESQLRAALAGYQASAPPTGTMAAAPRIQITFRTVPDPPRAGNVQLEATVTDTTGKPIDDADVTVQFFMPAMPAMNMPAMRSEAKLTPAGGGVYRGTGQVMMAGQWNATISVTQGGKDVGHKKVVLTAK